MKPKNKGGRPKFEPSKEQREIVKVMAGHNIEQAKIALALDIDNKTLRKHFKTELTNAAAMVEATLAASQFARAKQNTAVGQRATEFILNTRFGWKKQESVEYGGRNGAPIEHSIVVKRIERIIIDAKDYNSQRICSTPDTEEV